MITLVAHLWPGLAVVAIVAVAIGASVPRPGRTGRVLLALAALAWGLGLAASGLGSLAGRPALWLDSALLHGAAYGVGLGVGWVVSRLRPVLPQTEAVARS